MGYRGRCGCGRPLPAAASGARRPACHCSRASPKIVPAAGTPALAMYLFSVWSMAPVLRRPPADALKPRAPGHPAGEKQGIVKRIVGVFSPAGPFNRHPAVAHGERGPGRMPRRPHDRLWDVSVRGVVLPAAGDSREVGGPLGPPHYLNFPVRACKEIWACDCAAAPCCTGSASDAAPRPRRRSGCHEGAGGRAADNRDRRPAFS